MAPAAPRVSWQQSLRDRVVKTGIRLACGDAAQVGVSAGADVPLLSSGLRFAYLRMLGLFGVRSITARSGLGYNFVCHIGDAAEHPFYYRRAYELELAICTEWLRQEKAPVIYDLGANVGVFATHIAQMLAETSPTVFAFEPVAPTFAKLVESVRRLHLQESVFPIASAVSSAHGLVRMNSSSESSPYAQVAVEKPHARVGSETSYAIATVLDDFIESSGRPPSLIKLDVEGSEFAVLRGARKLLASASRPAILLEHNPTTLAEMGVTPDQVQDLLNGYRFHYVDDIEGQRMPFGQPVGALSAITWICNVFAVPRQPAAVERWNAALARAAKG